MTEWTLLHGDAREHVAALAPNSIDAVVTDPPYGLNFMGKKWDTGAVAFDVEFWKLVLAAMKPGAHLVAFSGTRTYHKMVTAIEAAGFEIRDQIGWLYGMGFPKSHDVSKGIDRALGAERTKVRHAASAVRNPKTHGGGKDGTEGATRPFIQAAQQLGYHEAASDEAAGWQGWGTALKPAWEPIVLARKPFKGTVVANVLAHGTGALNIDATRIGTNGGCAGAGAGAVVFSDGLNGKRADPVDGLGRWPANIVHDGSDEVLAAFPNTPGRFDKRGTKTSNSRGTSTNDVWGDKFGVVPTPAIYDEGGSAARFFYSAKATRADRHGSRHPTVKPVKLMRWLVRMITPPGGMVLDPFAGSGTTGAAAIAEGFDITLIEREDEYCDDICRRLGNDQPPREPGRAIYGTFADKNKPNRGGLEPVQPLRQ